MLENPKAKRNEPKRPFAGVQKVLITKNIKVIKVFEYQIPSNVVGIKKIEVNAMLRGRANIVLNHVGLYDQTS